MTTNMSSSVFKITEPDNDDAITLIVGADGVVSPDKEIVKTILSSRSSVDINLMKMKNVEPGKVNLTLDTLTYINSNEEIEDEEDTDEMREMQRTLRNIRMDHDYTPFTSPSQRRRQMDIAEDELAQTLSLLETGGLTPQTHSEPLTKITKIVKGKKQTIFVNNKQKAKMISTGLLIEKPSEPIFKKPKQLAENQKVTSPKTSLKLVESSRITEEEEEKVKNKSNEDDVLDEEYDEMEDDEYLNEDDDSDFEIEEELKKKPQRKLRTRKKSESRVKMEKAKSRNRSIEKMETEIPKSETMSVEEPKFVEKKPVIKKEKKTPKPIPDDFALFSAPDIIRRVGGGKEVPTDKQSNFKPAKITPENRSKSSNLDNKSKRASTENKNLENCPEKMRRLSLGNKKQTDRRISGDLKTGKDGNDQVIVQEFNEALNNSNESAASEDQLEPLPSAEDIRAIIQNENTKTFTSNLVIPDSTIGTDDQSNQMGLDSGGLDIDQSLLDNISTDMISEDILYQVAQSLVENTDLQNAIDKSINEGNLVLDANIQQSIGGDSLVSPNLENVNTNLSTQLVANTSDLDDTLKQGTQIIRPDGRIVHIPPPERPTTRSRNKRKQSTTPPSQPKPKKPLDEEHVSGNELDSSEDEDDEDESEDDPNKLWCICNQPHNNRFMICCDTCEEWYHGKCVNVTKAMGHLMEQQGKEWICVYCKDGSLKRPKAAARRIRKASRTSTDSGGTSSKKLSKSCVSIASSSSSCSSKSGEKLIITPACIVCGKPSRNSSIYCSDACILKHAQGVEKTVVFDRKTGKLLSGNNAPSAANLEKWLQENPSYEVVRSTTNVIQSASIKSKPETLTQSKLKIVKSSSNEGVSLAVQKKGINIGVLPHSPKETAIIPKSGRKITNLKVITKQISLNQSQNKTKILPITSKPILTSTPVKPKLVQTKISTTPVTKEKERPIPQKTPKSRQAEVNSQPKQENLRETVKKTFFEQLYNRLHSSEDLKLSDDELRSISNEIESQLYKCFGDTGQKYRTKYRSLIFNIKDPKNQTLWRKICEKGINAYQLVRLSHDDLASQELALWRERETKHQLDMIKKSELELLNCNRQYVFKTHKGEQVFEDDRPKDQVTEVISGLGADSTSVEKEEEKDKEKKAPNKHSRRDKSRDRGRSKDGSRSSKDKDRDSKERRKDGRSSSKDRKRRSKSRDRSRHRERKRSRSRDKHRKSSHKASRHKKEDKTINTEKLDKRSKEILEQLVDKHIVPPLEDRLWKHVPQEDVIPNPNAESDSDHEPSSTVTIPTPPRSTDPDESTSKEKAARRAESTESEFDGKSPPQPQQPFTEPIWKGTINMVDVAQISITAHEVSGDCDCLGDQLPPVLDIVGRISPDTVWDYIGKMKSSNSKTISVIRLTATNIEEKMPYLALYSYLSSRNRLGVVKTVTKAIKDFYILPLAGHTPIPDPLLPLSGPGFEDSRPALLIGVLVRDKRKRSIETSTHSTTKRVRVDIVPTSPGTPPSSSRSYTPPPTRDPRVKIPLPPPPPISDLPEEEMDEDMDEPYSPEDSDPDMVPEATNSRLNADDISNLLTGTVKSSSFLETGLNTKTFEPFSNKFDTIPGLGDTPALMPNSLELQRKMAILDQEIAAQKAEIDKVSQDIVSSATADIGTSTLANIALPSNLQQILESIKTIGSKTDSGDSQGENSNSSLPGISSDLTIPLMLPKLSSRTLIGLAGTNLKSTDITIPLNLPKPKSKTAETEKTGGSVLSSLSEEDLIKKAAEMLGEEEMLNKKPSTVTAPTKKNKFDVAQPPIPGLENS